MILRRHEIPTRIFSLLGLTVFCAIRMQGAAALPMDHPNFGYCPDLSRRGNVNACPGAGGGPRTGAGAVRRGPAGGTGGPAGVAGGPTAAQRACRYDYIAYCKGVQLGGGRAIACLSQHTNKLTAACREAIASGGEEPRAIRRHAKRIRFV
jgi:hypothetical protein